MQAAQFQLPIRGIMGYGSPCSSRGAKSMSKLPITRSTEVVTISPTPTPVRGLTDEALVAGWLALKRSEHTCAAYKRIAGLFLAELPMGLAQVQETNVADALERMCTGLSESSANTYRAIVKSLLTRAHKKKLTADNMGEDIKSVITASDRAAQRAERIIDEDAVKKILGCAASKRDRVLLGTLYSGALRVSEIVGLTWGNVRLDDGRVVLTVKGKGERKRLVRLDPIASSTLLKWRGETYDRAAPVFPSREGGGHLNVRTVRTMVQRTARRAEVEIVSTDTGGLKSRVSPHWLRHAHASHALARGKSVAVVRDTLGHANAATTDIYLHAKKKDTSADELSEDVLRAMDEDAA